MQLFTMVGIRRIRSSLGPSHTYDDKMCIVWQAKACQAVPAATLQNHTQPQLYKIILLIEYHQLRKIVCLIDLPHTDLNVGNVAARKEMSRGLVPRQNKASALPALRRPHLLHYAPRCAERRRGVVVIAPQTDHAVATAQHQQAIALLIDDLTACQSMGFAHATVERRVGADDDSIVHRHHTAFHTAGD